jgi:hypothetical protein
MGPAVSDSPAGLPDRRLQDWPLRLEALIAQRMAAPFEWGQRDCCLWAADVVLAVTGHDPAADLRGAYSTAAQAAAAIKRLHGIKAACARRLGPAVPPIMAQAGDVGLIMEGDRPAAVGYTGGNWLAQGPDGVVPVPDSAVFVAWRCIACPQP